jgi:hypothetical protein
MFLLLHGLAMMLGLLIGTPSGTGYSPAPAIGGTVVTPADGGGGGSSGGQPPGDGGGSMPG